MYIILFRIIKIYSECTNSKIPQMVYITVSLVKVTYGGNIILILIPLIGHTIVFSLILYFDGHIVWRVAPSRYNFRPVLVQIVYPIFFLSVSILFVTIRLRDDYIINNVFDMIFHYSKAVKHIQSIFGTFFNCAFES